MDIEIKSDAKDAYTECMDAFLDAQDGDTLRLVPVGKEAFVLPKMLDWTGKAIHVIATGAALYSQFLGPCVTFGGALGERLGGVTWQGGDLIGGMVVQNVDHSGIFPNKVMGSGAGTAALELRIDTAGGYNRFSIPGGLSGADIGLQITQLNAGAWSNFCRVSDTVWGTKTAIKTASPANMVPDFAPSLWLFDHCDFEGDNCKLLDSALNISLQFMNFCYCEGQWDIGTTGPGASICFDCWQGRLTGCDASDTRYNFMRKA